MEIYEQESKLYKALMHPARLAILDLLRDGEQCVCHMEAAFGYRQAYISQQLMVLKEAGLVDVRREGLNIYYRVIRPEIFGVLDAMRALTGKIPAAAGPQLHACTCPNCAGESVKPQLIQL
jgi:ArsR family transcriptional regulator